MKDMSNCVSQESSYSGASDRCQKFCLNKGLLFVNNSNDDSWLNRGKLHLKPNKPGLFEGSFFWGCQFDPLFIFQEVLI